MNDTRHESHRETRQSRLCETSHNALVILGPTAVGKTALANRLAEHFSTHLISADSRQVYKGLDIGSGKDLSEITVPYHLIDIATLDQEYSVYDYQKDFYDVFDDLQKKSIRPVVVGGTGMYLDAIIRSYTLIKVPTNIELRESLNGKNMDELVDILISLKGSVHATTDTEERHRLLRAIEIETYYKEHGIAMQREHGITAQKEHDIAVQKFQSKKPESTSSAFKPLILGTTFPRDVLRRGITRRLEKRLNEEGMIEEVEGLVASGVSHERLQRLGLEYKFVSLYLLNELTREEMVAKLNTAIHQFAKRQETWFRGMERKGVIIHWIECNGTEQECSIDARFQKALAIIARETAG